MMIIPGPNIAVIIIKLLLLQTFRAYHILAGIKFGGLVPNGYFKNIGGF